MGVNPPMHKELIHGVIVQILVVFVYTILIVCKSVNLINLESVSPVVRHEDSSFSSLCIDMFDMGDEAGADGMFPEEEE